MGRYGIVQARKPLDGAKANNSPTSPKAVELGRFETPDDAGMPFVDGATTATSICLALGGDPASEARVD